MFIEVVFSANNGVTPDKGNLIVAAKYTMDASGLSFAIVPQYLYALDSDAAVQYYYAVFNLDKDMYVSPITGKSSTLNDLDISGFVMLGATSI